MVTDYLLYENIDNIAAAFYGRQAALANKKYPDEYLIRVSYFTQIICKSSCQSFNTNGHVFFWIGRIKIENFILAV